MNRGKCSSAGQNRKGIRFFHVIGFDDVHVLVDQSKAVHTPGCHCALLWFNQAKGEQPRGAGELEKALGVL